MLKTTVVGNYPKLPSRPGDTNIRRLLHRFDKGKIAQAELDQAFAEVTERVIGEQVERGIDLLTDGQIRWNDIITPIAAGAAGFQIGGLIRWFDNNVLYRKPQIISPIKWTKAITVDNFSFAREKTKRPIKTVLPAPFSFRQLSDDRYYRDSDRLLEDVVTLLRRETESLIAAGATQIQFDEPSLQYHPKEIATAAAAINEVTRGLDATFWLCFYFGSVEEIVSKFDLFNVQVIAADCVSRPENFRVLLNLSGDYNVCFGLLDARNIKLEERRTLLEQYEKIALKFPEAYISPSCGLEFLPHVDALKKLELLAASVQRFNEGGGDA
ncbi:MAG: hypothetical protein KAT58_09945 [candidate division Zixibacteria bacterium]|nr:hypothetical protein [candidate division Zixibacteria bacterium]